MDAMWEDTKETQCAEEEFQVIYAAGRKGWDQRSEDSVESEEENWMEPACSWPPGLKRQAGGWIIFGVRETFLPNGAKGRKGVGDAAPFDRRFPSLYIHGLKKASFSKKIKKLEKKPWQIRPGVVIYQSSLQTAAITGQSEQRVPCKLNNVKTRKTPDEDGSPFGKWKLVGRSPK